MKDVKVFEREVVSAVKGRIKTRIMNPDGVVREQPWQRNLILDIGLDKVAYMPWACAFQWCVAGTGTTPTKVTTSSTASQSGSTVTIQSGTFQFVPGHVGKLIYWPTPNVEGRITGFIDSQHVQVSVAQTVATDTFVIYNVDQTALTTPYSMHCRYQTGDGFCGTTYSGNTVKLLRTFDFYMELSPVLITEVGFKEGPAVTELFSRILLDEPLYLSPGQWLQVSYELTLRLEPQSSTPRTPTVVGWPSTSGSEKIQLYGIAIIDREGIAHPLDGGHLANEPYAPGSQFLGPGWGYINRWRNGEISPIKIYSRFVDNPFINPREMAGKYAASSSKSYIPAGHGNTQWPSAGVSILQNARTDCMQPILQPPQYPTAESGNNGAWNGTDPYVHFPSPVPVYGQGGTWDNWKDEVSPDSISPISIGIIASGSNLGTPTYQWSKWNGLSYDVVIGANGTALSLDATTIAAQTEARFKVAAINGTVTSAESIISLFSADDTLSPAKYIIAITKTPFARRVEPPVGQNLLYVHADDLGPTGNSALRVDVYRNLVKLTPSSVATTGTFQLSMGANNVFAVDQTLGCAYLKKVGSTLYNGGYQTGYSVDLPSLNVLKATININIEGKFSGNLTSLVNSSLLFNGASNYGVDSGTYWGLPLIQPSTPYISSNLPGNQAVVLRGTGNVDVCGSSVFISENGSAHAALGSTVDRSVPRSVEIPLFLEPYTAKSFTRLKKGTFLTNMANGTNWRTIGVGGLDPDISVANRVNAAKNNTYAFIFDNPQTKLNTHELSVFFRYTWRRDFS